MSEPQSGPSVRKSTRETPDSADPAFVAKLQQASNLANTRYQETIGVLMPGRTILGGVELVIRKR